MGRFVDTSGRLRGELEERSAELDALVRWVESGSPDFGVTGMTALVDRLAALAVQWELSEVGVAGVRDALVGADVISETTFSPLVDAASLVALGRNRVVDDLAADLVRVGLTEALAEAIAAETLRLVAADPSLTVYSALRRASASATGVSEDELDRRARAFGLPRSAVAAVVLENLGEVERASGGHGHGVTLAGLRAVADHEGTPSELRDAAYRLASDPGLFNDLDSAARTRGVTPTGYDWSQVDGVIGRSDLEGFARQDGQIRIVLPWRLLLDTAADGFRLSGADGIVRARDVERFVHDRRVPEAVRRAAWDLYADTDPDLVRAIEPFDPSPSGGGDRDGDGLADSAGRALVGPMAGRSLWLEGGGRAPRLGTGEVPVPVPGSGGSGGAGFAGLMAAVVATVLEPVVDDGVDRGIGAWDRLRASGMPTSFVVFDPVTGQPVALDAGPLAGLSGDDAVAAVFWAAATGQVPAAGEAADPIPDGTWVDEQGVWRDGTTKRPLGGEPSWAAAGGTSSGSHGGADPEEPKPLRDPYQYEDSSGNSRWRDTNELVAQRPNRSWSEDEEGVWRWSDTGEPVQLTPETRAAVELDGLDVGAAREIAVARMVGGTVQGRPGGMGLPIVQPNVGASDVDVVAPNGDYIVVGGPAKASKFSLYVRSLHILRYAADEAGVGAKAYFDEGTPNSVVQAAERVLGKENVIMRRLLP